MKQSKEVLWKIRDAVREERKRSQKELAEMSKTDQNSYGAGVARGEVYAYDKMLEVLEDTREEMEND